ncbi:hypothetical protein XM38_005660 [Halomicronema hongdechloris C2206]|uniref:Uncharacterized protein n=1 Tax=Halomicronema hongdechloris C2206 TaxID=1641165 RepID=A0A1Z3HHF5_9CYAN|nr:hypothetical protein [Halomicronema hongdechloris]ASC69637.1 hypothetical protein XM38_005660 [Halomicronema hongdechloris C2206]
MAASILNHEKMNDQFDIGKELEDLDPEPSTRVVFTSYPETPEERQRLMDHTFQMERGRAFDRRVKMLVVETGPSILAALVVLAITITNLIVISPLTETTEEEEQRAASQMGLILTGTLAFVFGKASDSSKIP